MNTRGRSAVRSTSGASQRQQKPEVKKFIKIIQLSTIKEKMMKIPARFVRLGPKLSDTVTIKNPAGLKRSVRVKRIGDEVWLENGWSEFAEAHLLSEGHFLYFHYEGNSSFRVMIFDVTASEIEYPLDKVHVISDDDENEVIEIMDDDEEEEGVTRVESGDDDWSEESSDDDDSSEGVTDLEELLKKKQRVNVKSEKITIDLC